MIVYQSLEKHRRKAESEAAGSLAVAALREDTVLNKKILKKLCTIKRRKIKLGKKCDELQTKRI